MPSWVAPRSPSSTGYSRGKLNAYSAYTWSVDGQSMRKSVAYSSQTRLAPILRFWRLEGLVSPGGIRTKNLD